MPDLQTGRELVKGWPHDEGIGQDANGDVVGVHAADRCHRCAVERWLDAWDAELTRDCVLQSVQRSPQIIRTHILGPKEPPVEAQISAYRDRPAINVVNPPLEVIEYLPTVWDCDRCGEKGIMGVHICPKLPRTKSETNHKPQDSS